MAMVKNERDCPGAIDHFRLYSNLGTAFRRSCLSWYVGCVGHDFPIVFYLALGGSLLSYIYSAPPLKLKKRGHLLLKPRHWILISRYIRALQVTSASKRSISNLNDLHNLWKHLIFSST